MTRDLDYDWVAPPRRAAPPHSARLDSPKHGSFRSPSIGPVRWRITRRPREPTSAARTRSRTARANVPHGHVQRHGYGYRCWRAGVSVDRRGRTGNEHHLYGSTTTWSALPRAGRCPLFEMNSQTLATAPRKSVSLVCSRHCRFARWAAAIADWDGGKSPACRRVVMTLDSVRVVVSSIPRLPHALGAATDESDQEILRPGGLTL